MLFYEQDISLKAVTFWYIIPLVLWYRMLPRISVFIISIVIKRGKTIVAQHGKILDNNCLGKTK